MAESLSNIGNLMNLRFRIDKHVTLCCRVLDVSPDAVLRRCNLPEAILSPDFKGVSAAAFFDVWEAIDDEYDGDDMALKIGEAIARNTVFPAVFAFACSPNIKSGLKRFAVFQPLIGPFKLHSEEQADGLRMWLEPLVPELNFPNSMAECLMVLFTDRFRAATGQNIRLRALTLPAPMTVSTDYFGCQATRYQHPSLTITAEDAASPLISEDPILWSSFEPKLQRKLAESMIGATTEERLRNALLEAIPSGEVSADQLARRMHLSKRTLHRRLRDEGESFQSVLDTTRSDLARHYLSKTEYTLDDIAYLLGFSTSSSFSRAFKGWFATSPSEFKRSGVST